MFFRLMMTFVAGSVSLLTMRACSSSEPSTPATTNMARVANGVALTATGGHVKVSATDQTDATAKAIGTALCTSGDCDANIGAAVGLNVVQVTSTAEIGTGATISGAGVTVEAIIPAGQRNDFIAWGLAAAGGDSEVAVAASVGIVVVNYDTTAKIGAGSNIDSTAGVTVNATNKIGLQNLALAGGASLDGSAAVGGAIAVNVLDDVTTVASIASTTGPDPRLRE